MTSVSVRSVNTTSNMLWKEGVREGPNFLSGTSFFHFY